MDEKSDARRWAWWPIALVAVYGLTLAATAVIGTSAAPVPPAPLANLLDKPFGEDAFYMFSVARSLAAGQGINYGGVPTTGVQPLAMFLYACIYWCAGRIGLWATAPLRIILAANVALLVLTGCLTGALVTRWAHRRGVPRAKAFWIAATILVVNPIAFRLFGYGLETGLYLCTIVALQLAVDAAPRPLTLRDQFVIGVLTGLCVLARLDFLILGLVVFGGLVLTRRFRLVDALGISTIALVVVAPWLAYVHSVMGGFMPSSGAAQAGVVNNAAELAARAWTMAAVLVGALSLVVYLPVSAPLPILALLGVLLVGLWWAGPSMYEVSGENRFWLAGAAVLALYYLFFSAADNFYSRYVAPFWLLWTQLVAASVVLVLARQPEPHALVAYHVGALALASLFAVQIGYTIHRGTAGNTNLSTAFYIRDHQAELGTVGAFQSGVVGYVNNERVINLDGKLDGHALAWRLRGRLECYLAERGVHTLIDWPSYIYDRGMIAPSFVATHMRQVGRVPGGDALIMSVDTAGISCQ